MRFSVNTMTRQPGTAGVTLVELMISLVIFGVVLIILNTVFISSNRVYGSTAMRAGQQMSQLVGLSVITEELRTAGCDPNQNGLAAFAAATANSVHIQADFNGDGALQTAEPSENVTFTWTQNTQTVSRDPGTGAQVFMRNVSAFQFQYYDAANTELVPPLTAAQRDLIRSVRVAFTTTTNRGGVVTADTRVALRND
ncbi:MAG TPA: prepilin-type N-terminal cleavage/methylation domain-containing protein [Candidatus Krumholzibacteria bacterium]|nr:prepilin-type N-terminal cleavage/methylation domain-containing protein [Candidatus Krumholzibacteria bacterium]